MTGRAWQIAGSLAKRPGSLGERLVKLDLICSPIISVCPVNPSPICYSGVPLRNLVLYDRYAGKYLIIVGVMRVKNRGFLMFALLAQVVPGSYRNEVL